jgi:hypothetical protein
VDGTWAHPCDAAYDDWYESQIADGAKVLTARGARVVLLAPAQSTLPWGPPELNERLRCLGDVERRLARTNPSVAVIDLNRFVCPRGVCRDRIDGTLLRPDGLHFDGEGADIVTRWLAPRVRSRARAPVSSAKSPGALASLTGPTGQVPPP